MSRFIFLDLETTGLTAGVDQITEAAWVLEDGTERQFFVEHDRLPNEWVLRRTDYLERIALAPKVPMSIVMNNLWADCERPAWSDSSTITTHLVGACPAFDDRFLRTEYTRRVGYEPPYHYHVIDVETMAMGAFGLDVPPPLKELRAMLGIEGENPAAHTAMSDAREVKIIWDALRARRVAP